MTNSPSSELVSSVIASAAPATASNGWARAGPFDNSNISNQNVSFDHLLSAETKQFRIADRGCKALTQGCAFHPSVPFQSAAIVSHPLPIRLLCRWLMSSIDRGFEMLLVRGREFQIFRFQRGHALRRGL